MSERCIAIIGAGFSGTLLALHLMRHCRPDVRIVLIERREKFGLGAAYSTGNESHLLNVPAGKMSAFPNRPQDFLTWLKSAQAKASGGADPAPDTFVPRAVFGQYITQLLELERKSAVFCGGLDLIHGDVIDLAQDAEGIMITLDDGRRIMASRTVLAVGNFPPSPPPVRDASFYDTPFFSPDPWAVDALAALERDAPVLLIGTGLTMVDVAISLLDQSHRGPIIALSRRGLLPRVHCPAEAGGVPGLAEGEPCPTRLLPLTRYLRARIDAVEAAGRSWHAVIDALRPLTTEIWQAMPIEDRRRFLRHLRPWWDTHRHRMAPAIAEQIDGARRAGQLLVTAGRIRAYEVGEDRHVTVRFQPRFATHEESIIVRRVINCAGPESDFSRVRDPLVRTLLANGTVRPDNLGLGLDVTQTCAVLNREGAISRRLFAIGPLTKGAFWEMTAVPDIRQQAETLAGHLALMLLGALKTGQPAADLAWSI